ncbi:MAG: hypothetical protein K5860_09775 [Bacteroidales bacterium]|nr:hypothetical protein [Bacteroidales bacterium]
MDYKILNQVCAFRTLTPEPKVKTLFDEIKDDGLERAYSKLTNYLLDLAKTRFQYKHPDKLFDKTQLQGLEAVRDWIFGYKKTSKGFEKIDREKGLWLYGDVGTGKTFAMKVFCDFLYSVCKEGSQYKRCNLVLFRNSTSENAYFLPVCVPIVQAREIRQQYNSVLNHEEVELFHNEYYMYQRWMDYESGRTTTFRPVKVDSENELMQRYLNLPVLIIDDLGAENGILNHYGTKINVIEEIISGRYDKDKLTFVTTNIVNPQDVYEKRICSRISEMFTSVLVDGKDFRMAL